MLLAAPFVQKVCEICPKGGGSPWSGDGGAAHGRRSCWPRPPRSTSRPTSPRGSPVCAPPRRPRRRRRRRRGRATSRPAPRAKTSLALYAGRRAGSRDASADGSRRIRDGMGPAWIFRGDGSRRRRGCHVDIPRRRVAGRRVATPPRVPRGSSEAESRRPRVPSWIVRDRIATPPRVPRR